jgi:hypothetical protein
MRPRGARSACAEGVALTPLPRALDRGMPTTEWPMANDLRALSAAVHGWA